MTARGSIRVIVVRSLLVALVIAVALTAPCAVQSFQNAPRTALPVERLQVARAFEGNRAPDAFTQAAAERVRHHMGAAGMPGVSVAIAHGDSLLWAAGFGYADIASQQPVELDARFRVGSAAKPITSIVLGRLVERGALDLDRPIGTYVPDLPEHLHPLTARQLASHTAGIRHYRPTDFNPYTGDVWKIEGAGLNIFAGDALEFTPGTDFAYSTYGYTLLSVVLAAAGGADFLTLIEREVAVPAGMTATSGDLPEAQVPGRVAFYTTDGSKYAPAIPQNTSYKWAGGGIVSSALDLVRMGRALADTQLVSAATRDLIWTPVPLADGSANDQNYALGWRRDTSTRLLGEDRPELLLHHGGLQIGGVSFLMVLPERSIAVAALANTGARAAREAVQELTYDLVRLAIDGEIQAASSP